MMMILITLATTTITNSGINSGPMTSCVHSHSLCSHQTKFRLFQNSFPFVEFNAKLIVSTPTLHACEGKIISVHVMKAYKEVKAQFHSFGISALPFVPPGRFTSWNGCPGTHKIGGWVGPRTGLHILVDRRIPWPRRESKPNFSGVQLVVQSLNRLSYPCKSMGLYFVIKAKLINIHMDSFTKENVISRQIFYILICYSRFDFSALA